ncbi:MAG: hypothetical protein EA349_10945, partial [Halomonadaceae bacterium]
CDHGFLGRALLISGKARYLVLVDQLPNLEVPLQGLMADQDPSCYDIRIADASRLQLSPQQRQLVIVAGVGQDTVLAIVAGLCAGNDCRDTEFLLSPTGDILALRRQLRAMGFVLLGEGFVSERGRGYPFIKVCLFHSQETQALTDLGQFWDPACPDQHRYLSRLKAHYQRQLYSPGLREQLTPALEALDEVLAG